VNSFDKILGAIFPPHKFKVLREEGSKLFMSIISALPDDFGEIKSQTLLGKFWSFDDWQLYPDFKFVTLNYGGERLFQYRKRWQNYKISGLRIFSKKNNDFEDIEILIRDNLIHGLKITNSDYQLKEFDLKRISGQKIIKAAFYFPPNEIDIFYNSLSNDVKNFLGSDDIFDVDFNNSTFYVFHDLEDGNYLAVDKKLKVYSLVHDANAITMEMKTSFLDILKEIYNGKFDKEKHIKQRYK